MYIYVPFSCAPMSAQEKYFSTWKNIFTIVWTWKNIFTIFTCPDVSAGVCGTEEVAVVCLHKH